MKNYKCTRQTTVTHPLTISANVVKVIGMAKWLRISDYKPKTNTTQDIHLPEICTKT